MPMRPPSRDDKAIRPPWPRSPSRLPAGTRQPSKTISAVDEHLIPSFFSILPTLMPGNDFSTMNTDTPRAPAVDSVRAYTMHTSASTPFVTKAFVPHRIHSPFFNVAVVRSDMASEPDMGSVRQ
jgi:hypothetical protein